MRRFVVLHHRLPAESPRATHWDFMIEDDGVLRTWALARSRPRERPFRPWARRPSRWRISNTRGPSRATGARFHAGIAAPFRILAAPPKTNCCWSFREIGYAARSRWCNRRRKSGPIIGPFDSRPAAWPRPCEAPARARWVRPIRCGRPDKSRRHAIVGHRASRPSFRCAPRAT